MNLENLRFDVAELVFNVCEKSYRNSRRNRKKIMNCGLSNGHKYHLGNNVWIAFIAEQGGIIKNFYWGNRAVKKETAIKRLGLEQMV